MPSWFNFYNANLCSTQKKMIMNRIKSITISFLSTILLFACNGSSDNIKAAQADASITNSPDPSTLGGNASFAYKIDGKVFSGNGTDNYFNCVFKHPGNMIHFILTDLNPNLTKVQPQFSFSVADNGTTVVRKDDMDRLSSGNNVKYFANFSIPGGGTGEIPRYEFNEASTVTVTITSGSSSRLKGTFSGQLENPDTEKVVQVTDGKFDLPIISTSK
jgi:hypothetical protein